MTAPGLRTFVLTLCICSSVFGQDPELVERAEGGDAEAQIDLGFIYGMGSHGLSKDTAEAVKWFRKAAGKGHRQAQITLGVMYDTGEGIPEDNT